jgi:pimeloyl-ACP methyl ester carboxylesterase
MTYLANRIAHRETLIARGLSFQLYRWPGRDPQPTVLLHGWGDTGETWQFVVDALSQRRTLIAFDARGFGRSQRPGNGYWFPDYLADLEALIDQLSPHAPVDLIGHSMGGNVAMLYAGIRPHRVRRLITLEGVGLAPTTADQAPGRYREWLDELKQGAEFATYDSFEQFAQVLARRNPRTSVAQLDFIARAWGTQRSDGRIELRADSRHKRVNPVLYQHEQVQACWKEITAPVLFVSGDQSEFARRMAPHLAAQHLKALLRDLTIASIADAGHMMHHERPAAVAELIDEFLR